MNDAQVVIEAKGEVVLIYEIDRMSVAYECQSCSKRLRIEIALTVMFALAPYSGASAKQLCECGVKNRVDVHLDRENRITKVAIEATP